jgi:hypothetical protein
MRGSLASIVPGGSGQVWSPPKIDPPTIEESRFRTPQAAHFTCLINRFRPISGLARLGADEGTPGKIDDPSTNTHGVRGSSTPNVVPSVPLSRGRGTRSTGSRAGRPRIGGCSMGADVAADQPEPTAQRRGHRRRILLDQLLPHDDRRQQAECAPGEVPAQPRQPHLGFRRTETDRGDGETAGRVCGAARLTTGQMTGLASANQFWYPDYRIKWVPHCVRVIGSLPPLGTGVTSSAA